MPSSVAYAVAADAVLLMHIAFVLFVVFGLILVLLGKIRAWNWVRNPWFRVIHLLAIAIVVLQSWFDVICPLTIWEMQLRSKAEQAVYQGSFITHWLGEMLYFDAPAWVFVAAYSGFGLMVVLSWFWVRPRSFN